MSLTSWPMRCPCSKCKSSKFQSLGYVVPGKWACPESGESFDVNLTQKARAERKHVEHMRGWRRR